MIGHCPNARISGQQARTCPSAKEISANQGFDPGTITKEALLVIIIGMSDIIHVNSAFLFFGIRLFSQKYCLWGRRYIYGKVNVTGGYLLMKMDE